MVKEIYDGYLVFREMGTMLVPKAKSVLVSRTSGLMENLFVYTPGSDFFIRKLIGQAFAVAEVHLPPNGRLLSVSTFNLGGKVRREILISQGKGGVYEQHVIFEPIGEIVLEDSTSAKGHTTREVFIAKCDRHPGQRVQMDGNSFIARGYCDFVSKNNDPAGNYSSDVVFKFGDQFRSNFGF